MLLTNFIRSASYEALPNQRPFPAKSGLTSRFALRNRCLEEADETAVVGQFGREAKEFVSPWSKAGGMLDKIATCKPCGSRLLVVASPFQSWFSAAVTMGSGREMWGK